MNRELSQYRDYMFRGLMFEAEARTFQQAGIQVGADLAQAEERLLSENLAMFAVSQRNDALQMARLYAVLHCFENSVRDFIRETLEEKDGPDWIAKIPPSIKKFAEERQASAIKDSWLEGMKTDVLGFVEFGHLAQIIIARWEHFAGPIPTQHWLKQKLDELEKVRHYIAHNRMLQPSEFQRVYMYIADWNRVVGI